MKKYFLFFAMALLGAGFTACSDSKDDPDPGPEGPGETKEYAIDATASSTWNYFSCSQGKVIGTGAETEVDNAAWAARSDWDFAVNRYSIRTNSGDASSMNAQGGVYTCAESVTFSSLNAVPAGLSFSTDKPITSSGMGGETTVVKSDATVILFKKNEDGSSIMPPVYLQAPVYIFRSADGDSFYKVLFTQYKDANNVTGKVLFDMARIYQ